MPGPAPFDSAAFSNAVPALPGPHAALLALRARAEQRRHLVTQAAEPLTPAETQRLVQELQVHQIELEMQNEELLLAQAEAEAARARYVDLYDFAPVGYFSLSPAGQIEQLNLRAAQLLGTVRQRLVGRRFALFLTPDQRLEFGQFLTRVFRADRTQSLELRLQREDGVAIFGQLEGLRVLTAGGPQCRLAVLDTTERRRAAEALRHEKEFTESLLENSVDGLIALDRAQRITAWNAEAARSSGLGAAQVLGRPVFEVLPLDADAPARVARALAGEHIARLGQPLPGRPGCFDVFLVPLLEAGQALPTGVLVIVRDVTERDRLAEEATQQRLRQQQQVLAAILSTQETERKRIAEALHNGLGQLLYATKLSLGTKGPPAARPRDTLGLLEEAIRTTRTISFELTPGILEDFGLRTALEELVKRIAPARLPVRLHFTNLELRAPPPVEISVYRVVQELLNNVMKHAHATEVEVHVARENGRLEVSVEDNGQGFDPTLLATEPLAGIGLAGVRNRVALLGGKLAISSQVGRGTIISFGLAG